MKLIQEATTDDTFNKQMMKIQDAIEALEKIPFSADHKPVGTQVRALKVSAEDLNKLAQKFDGLLQTRRSNA